MKQFLKQIYEVQCEVGDYIVLAAKGENWRDVPIRYDKNFDRSLDKFFKQYPPEQYDLYWSPMPYSKPKRRIENSLVTKFLAQDID